MFGILDLRINFFLNATRRIGLRISIIAKICAMKNYDMPAQRYFTHKLLVGKMWNIDKNIKCRT